MEAKSASIHVLKQLQELTLQLSDEEYGQPVALLNGSSIGQHVRHSLEFFICLMKGLSSGTINYDLRKRDHRIETERLFALSVSREIQQFIENFDESPKLLLEGSYAGTGTFSVASNFERELIYNIEHTIHHMALMRIGLKGLECQTKLPADFGIASSTTRYQQHRG